MNFTKLGLVAFALILSVNVFSQEKFKQLKEELATPNVYRTASGAPGHEYWQQKADYKIDLELDDEKQKIYGEETITYVNNSPDALSYLWVQLDQNMRAKDSQTKQIKENKLSDKMYSFSLDSYYSEFDGGFKIDHVKDANGKALPHTINYTMMRIDLPKPLKAGGKFVFSIKWWYNINNALVGGGRSGYEHFEEEDNYVYSIAQFYPRMAVYNEVEGWQNKQFLGRGEFALTFGDYEVNITVPSDHIIASTGELQNAKAVLTKEQRERFEKSKTAKEPVVIVSQDEAEEKEKTKSDKKSTWTFKASNVRDFAFASSRKFIWDAMGVKFGARTVMAMSYYPKEGNPIWGKYSTKAVAHTLKTYSKYTFDYPYPVAISSHAVFTGMEYPMISFNFGRPEADGTYTPRTKYGMIGVIIHEVGHNYFPMIVNSDERQWTWMDEGLNSFLQYLTEQEWEHNYPSRRGPAYKITSYMGGDKSKISPIMTNSESIYQFGNNAYGKPATALNILRETVMGRELFDFAFKTYSQRWMFKHPTPADFFRTMEDASGVDLDWFWRGWFYTTDHVDIAVTGVKWSKLDSQNPDVEKELARKKDAEKPRYITDVINDKLLKGKTELEKDASLVDFYNEYDEFDVTILDKKSYKRYYNTLSDKEKKYLEQNDNFYEVTFENKGGLVMPIIVQLNFKDGTTELHRIPVEIWRFDSESVTKTFVTKKEVESVSLDPYVETADVETSNNHFPPKAEMSKFQIYKYKKRSSENTMQKMKRAKEMEKK
ncbi:MAG: M1 family metallopeptidase [Saprospiraceae bacterium]